MVFILFSALITNKAVNCSYTEGQFIPHVSEFTRARRARGGCIQSEDDFRAIFEARSEAMLTWKKNDRSPEDRGLDSPAFIARLDQHLGESLRSMGISKGLNPPPIKVATISRVEFEAKIGDFSGADLHTAMVDSGRRCSMKSRPPTRSGAGI